MKKAKISVAYKFVNEIIGTLPYIHIEYINESKENLDAAKVLQGKIENAIVNGSGYYCGKTIDGKNFKIKDKKKIPLKLKEPIYITGVKKNEIKESENTDIEIILKKQIIDALAPLGDGITLDCYSIDSNGNIITSEKKVQELKSEEDNISIIGDIHINSKTELQDYYNIETKINIIIVLLMKLYAQLNRNAIGFTNSLENYKDVIEIEVNGINIELLQYLPNFVEEVYSTILTFINMSNETILKNMQSKQIKLKKHKQYSKK